MIAKNVSTSAVDVLSYSDYYPHGGVLPGRNFVSSPSYRFGGSPQGQEKDAETGFANFELRQLDPRLGRWFNPDPMGQYFSPYLAMGNNPVSMVDPTGGWDAYAAGDDIFASQFDFNFQHGGASYGAVTASGNLYSSNEQINDAVQIQEQKNRSKSEENKDTGGIITPRKPDGINGVMLPEVDISTNGNFSYDVHGLVQSIRDNIQWYESFAKDGILYLNGIHAGDIKDYIGTNVLATGVPVQDVYDMQKMLRDREVWKQYGENFNDLADASEVAVLLSFAIAGGGVGYLVATEVGLYTIIVESKVITKMIRITSKTKGGFDATTKSLKELQSLVGGKNAKLLRDLFGKNEKGAKAVLDNIKNVNVPQGLSRETLQAYRELINRVGDPRGTQAIRAKIIDELLKRGF